MIIKFDVEALFALAILLLGYVFGYYAGKRNENPLPLAILWVIAFLGIAFFVANANGVL